MMALWAPGLGGDLVITDPTKEPTSSVLRDAHAAHRGSQTLSHPADRSPPPPTDHRHASSGWGEAPLVLRVRVGST